MAIEEDPGDGGLTHVEACLITLGFVKAIRGDPNVVAEKEFPTVKTLDLIKDSLLELTAEAFLLGQSKGIRESDAAYEEILELAMEPSRN